MPAWVRVLLIVLGSWIVALCAAFLASPTWAIRLSRGYSIVGTVAAFTIVLTLLFGSILFFTAGYRRLGFSLTALALVLGIMPVVVSYGIALLKRPSLGWGGVTVDILFVGIPLAYAIGGLIAAIWRPSVIAQGEEGPL